MSKIAAVTGATGFVGTHLIHTLTQQGYTVKALTRRPQPGAENITWIEGDLENEAALQELITDADVVYHLAGVVKARNYDGFASVNITATKRLIDIIKKSQQKPHFIQLSSLTAREPQLSDYAVTKYLGEQEVRNHLPPVPWTIFRPPGIYGPGDYEILKLFKGIKCHLGLIPGSNENRISIIYVEDLVSCLIAAAGDKNAYSKTLDIDDGKKDGYSVAEFTNIAADILNIKIISLTIPKFILKSFGYINYICAKIFRYTPMVTHKKVNELCFPDWICKDEHARDVIDWQPKTDVDTGLRKTLGWYEEKKLL